MRDLQSDRAFAVLKPYLNPAGVSYANPAG